MLFRSVYQATESGYGCAGNILVGKTNKTGIDISQGADSTGMDEVFLTIGEALAGALTNDKISEFYFQQAFVNITQTQSSLDISGLAPANPKNKTFAAAGIGFGQMSLGADRIVNYVADALTRSQVEKLLWPYLQPDLLKDGASTISLIEGRAKEIWPNFLLDSGLDENGSQDQIIDQLFPKDWEASVKSFASEIVDTKVQDNKPMPLAKFTNEVWSEWETSHEDFLKTLKDSISLNASKWVPEIQDKFREQLSYELTQSGYPVILDLIKKLEVELKDFSLPQLLKDHKTSADFLKQVSKERFIVKIKELAGPLTGVSKSNGDFLGKTVQVIPHITDEIKRRMTIYDKMFDIVIIEIGGTVGDIESLPFMESVRQLCMEKGPKSTLNIHLTYVPYIKSAGELKTKPTQHSVKMLMEMGIRPDILLCRTEQTITKDLKSKIALFCNVEEDSVIEVLDAETIYEVPMSLAKRNLDQIVLRKFSVSPGKIDLETWIKFVNRIKQPKHTVNIALVGKYNQVKDSYKSILEAFFHAGAINNAKVDITWIDSESITKSNVASILKSMQGILVAPGFGSRGIEGKIETIRFAREQKIPFFGICLGMQCAVIEFARNVAGIKDAHSAEFKKGKDLVIHLMSTQKQVTEKGGTMRLGSYPCTIRKGTIAHAAYGTDSINERHRHRYEFNNAYRKTLEDHGMKLSGVSPDTTLVEIIELKNHPWFVGVQFHPEYKSRAVKGHPLFTSFIKAALQKK